MYENRKLFMKYYGKQNTLDMYTGKVQQSSGRDYESEYGSLKNNYY
jgi:hypothetical protein